MSFNKSIFTHAAMFNDPFLKTTQYISLSPNIHIQFCRLLFIHFLKELNEVEKIC